VQRLLHLLLLAGAIIPGMQCREVARYKGRPEGKLLIRDAGSLTGTWSGPGRGHMRAALFDVPQQCVLFDFEHPVACCRPLVHRQYGTAAVSTGGVLPHRSAILCIESKGHAHHWSLVHALLMSGLIMAAWAAVKTHPTLPRCCCCCLQAT
jgi:hypothetical protein